MSSYPQSWRLDGRAEDMIQTCLAAAEAEQRHTLGLYDVLDLATFGLGARRRRLGELVPNTARMVLSWGGLLSGVMVAATLAVAPNESAEARGRNLAVPWDRTVILLWLLLGIAVVVSTFGGVYFDGEVVLGLFTDDIDLHADALRHGLHAPQNFRVGRAISPSARVGKPISRPVAGDCTATAQIHGSAENRPDTMPPDAGHRIVQGSRLWRSTSCSRRPTMSNPHRTWLRSSAG
ncbi:MAG: hypothetical protein M3N95_12275 [Actinomycetota bacterium]|nr:hypothetical protein [Actinomycetota bacterium]